MTAAFLSGRIGSRGRRLLVSEVGWIMVATAGVFALSAVLAPGTLRPSALASIMPFAALLAIVAVGQTLVIQQRGLDMSAAGMVSLGGVAIAQVYAQTGSLALALLGAIGLAMAFGCLNGWLIVRLNVAPIVTTLATNALMTGLVRSLSGGSATAAPPALGVASQAAVLGVPMLCLVGAGVTLLAAALIRLTATGRRFVAAGANPQAAAAAGLRVTAIGVGTYCVAALCFALTGVLNAGFIGSATQTAGGDFLLAGIAAVVIGGTPFTGGRGSVIAGGIAALFMTQLIQMTLALGASTAVQLLVQAAIIVLAIALRSIVQSCAPADRVAGPQVSLPAPEKNPS